MASMRSSTQEISNTTDRNRPSRTHSNSGILDGALRAEQSRLLQQKRTGQFKALLVLAVLGGLTFGVIKAWKPYISPMVTNLLKEPPLPPPPPAPPPTVEEKPAPPPPPPKPSVKRKPGKRGKAETTATGPVTPRSGSGDDVMSPE
jgi:hypothetical protein